MSSQKPSLIDKKPFEKAKASLVQARVLLKRAAHQLTIAKAEMAWVKDAETTAEIAEKQVRRLDQVLELFKEKEQLTLFESEPAGYHEEDASDE